MAAMSAATTKLNLLFTLVWLDLAVRACFHCAFLLAAMDVDEIDHMACCLSAKDAGFAGEESQ